MLIRCPFELDHRSGGKRCAWLVGYTQSLLPIADTGCAAAMGRESQSGWSDRHGSMIFPLRKHFRPGLKNSGSKNREGRGAGERMGTKKSLYHL